MMKWVFFLAALTLTAQPKQIAITIDDLPCVGCRNLAEAKSITSELLKNLKDAPAIGFVNEVGLQVQGERDARIALLEQWIEAGKMLGNHTYSHPDTNKVSLEEYTDDIVRGEVVTKQLMARRGVRNLYFRHPFTHTGPTKEYKEGLDRFLASRGYTIAPFTVENEDYAWALIYRRTTDEAVRDRVQREYIAHLDLVLAHMAKVSGEVFGREIPQILIIHANSLNAHVMPAMLEMFSKRGYSVVSLEKAMSDAAFATPDTWVGRFGPSWLYRWARAAGKKVSDSTEPELPTWMRELYQNYSAQ